MAKRKIIGTTNAPIRADSSGVTGYVGTTLRLKPEERAHILKIVRQGAMLQQQLTSSDVLRIALMAFDPQCLKMAPINALRAKDGRVLRRRKQHRP